MEPRLKKVENECEPERYTTVHQPEWLKLRKNKHTIPGVASGDFC